MDRQQTFTGGGDSGEVALQRKVPFSLIAEQSLLGSVLIDPGSFSHVADLVASTDFYLPITSRYSPPCRSCSSPTWKSMRSRCWTP